MKARSFSPSVCVVIILITLSAASILNAQCPSLDFNHDCRVDLHDFNIVSAAWLLDYTPQDLIDLSAQWNAPMPPPEGIVFVTIPAGTFQMGDSFNEGEANEKPVHTVTLSTFQISKYEITNAQYAWFLNALNIQRQIKLVDGAVYHVADRNNIQPFCDTHASGSDSQIDFVDGAFIVLTRDGQSQLNHPVVEVSWHGADAFCFFYGYRLPTEAQWEYAARGGDSLQRFANGQTINHSLANFYSSWRAGQPAYAYDTCASQGYHPTYNTGTPPFTAPVGSFAPNAFNLHDMTGNAWEWCADRYGNYSDTPATDPTGPLYGNFRVFRGGSWYDNACYCRTACRGAVAPSGRSNAFGFRVCLP